MAGTALYNPTRYIYTVESGLILVILADVVERVQQA